MKVYIHPDVVPMIPVYLKRRKADVVSLQKWIKLKDFVSIQNLGHKIFGNGTMFGLSWISEVGKVLETSAINKDLLKIQKHTQELSEYITYLEIFTQGDL